MKLLAAIVLLSVAVSASAVEPGDVIINEVRFNQKSEDSYAGEAVELLVVADKVDLNGLQISDRNDWDKETEDQCTLNDLSLGFLTEVRSGTLIVIHAGRGEDDTNGADFTLTFHVKSSPFVNAAPTGKGFSLYNQADNIHLLHNGRQVDFVKYCSQEKRLPFSGNPGSLHWENGVNGYIDTSSAEVKVGFRFVGDSPELNDYPVAWRTYTANDDDNFGKPNGGRNTEWINLLRAKATFDQSASSSKTTPVPMP